MYKWYKWYRGDLDDITKYWGDNKTQLELSDDAARANWGGSWRMPTLDELTELMVKCTWAWTTQNGVKGYKVTSKTNGRSIFLPVAGCRFDSSLIHAGSDGRFWSSSLYAGDPDCAGYVGFGSSTVDWFSNLRYYGLSVRPVCP